LSSYEDKELDYFAHPRKEIEALLPAGGCRVLEIGCGTGATLSWLRREKGYVHTTGCEISSKAAAHARTCVDEVIVGNAESLTDEQFARCGSFDVVLCLDVLEHMLDPWAFLSRLRSRLDPRGTLIASIPNARNVDLIGPLVLKGKWDYRPEGILDKTHLRFFTRSTALDLIAGCGLKIDRVLDVMPAAGSRRSMINRVTFGVLRDFFTVQFLISARQADP